MSPNIYISPSVTFRGLPTGATAAGIGASAARIGVFSMNGGNLQSGGDAVSLSRAATLSLLTSQSMDKSHAVDPRELQAALNGVFRGNVSVDQVSNILLDLVTSQSNGKTATVDISEVRSLMRACIRPA